MLSHPISRAVSSTTSLTIAAPTNNNNLSKLIQTSIWKTTLLSLSFATARHHGYFSSVSLSPSLSSRIHLRSYSNSRLVLPRQTIATAAPPYSHHRTSAIAFQSGGIPSSSRCGRFEFAPPPLFSKIRRMTTLSSL